MILRSGVPSPCSKLPLYKPSPEEAIYLLSSRSHDGLGNDEIDGVGM